MKGPAAGFDIAVTGNDDDRPVDPLFRQLLLQLQSGDSRHADIEDEAARFEPGELTEKHHRIGKALRLDADGGQEQYQRLAYGVIIIHEINGERHGVCASAASGRTTRKSAPFSLST
ncbi:hypothetical protein D3C86_1061150 [compost metagenome]